MKIMFNGLDFQIQDTDTKHRYSWVMMLCIARTTLMVWISSSFLKLKLSSRTAQNNFINI
jgi:hypothetical protein